MTQKKKTNNCSRFLFHVVIPIVICSALYYLFCPEVLFVKQIDNVLPVQYHIYGINKIPFLMFCRNYLFDAVWGYSLFHAVFLILGNDAKALVWSILICILMSIGLETLQKFHVITGTFDWWDIIVEMLALAVASLVIYKKYMEVRE